MSTVRHYDSHGNPIVAFFEMRKYYQNDSISQKIVSNVLPCRYVCIPDTVIRICKLPITTITVYRVFPGGQVVKDLEPTPRVLGALRRAYKGRGGWVGRQLPDGVVEISRKGRVIVPRYQKFLRF